MKKYFTIAILFFAIKTQAQTFSGSGGSIPDNGPAVAFNISVSGLGATTLNQSFGVVQVCLNINHTYDGDLVAKLIAPDGTVVSLFTNIGGGGQNFVNACFDSVASSLPIGSGSAPFTGTFLPEGCLGNFNNNQNGNGIWTLQIQDVAAQDTGSVISWQITFGNNAPTPFNMTSNIPLVILNTNNQSIPYGSSSSIFAEMKIIDHGIGQINNSNDAPNVYNGKININVRGHYSAALPQLPYGLTTYKHDESNDSDVTIFNMPLEHDWILLAGYNDKSFVRNTLMYKLFKDMGHYDARTKHCEVILNGEYLGIYIFLEKIKRDKNRVSIAKLKTSDTTGGQLTGGYIFTHDYYSGGWTSNFAPDSCNTRFYDYNFEYPSSSSIQPQQANYIKRFVDTLETRLYSSLYKDSVWGYRQKVNTNSFADYLLCNELSWNGDGFKKSMFFHKDKDSNSTTLHAGPIWDFDWALKRMPWTPTDYSGWYYAAAPCSGDVLYLPWWNIMMQDTLFQNEVKCHWDYYRQNTFSTAAINHYIDSMAAILNQAQLRHFTRWKILGINTGTPEVPPFSASYQQEIDTLKSIIQQRMEWMDKNLLGTCREAYNPNTAVPDIINKTVLKCYPNPANQQFTVAYNGENANKILVFNNVGQQIFSQQIANSNFNLSIDCSKWSNGLYLVEVQSQSGSPAFIKFMKQ